MIGYLQGEVLENSEGKILVGIGQKSPAGMIGYSVQVPHSAEYLAFPSGQIIALYIYSHIREDAFDLYGFSSTAEKELFLMLLSVNGIGPKSGLAVLSAVDQDSLIEAIISGDQNFLTKISGIGKKTAERLVVELRDSLRKKVESGGLGASKNSSSSLPSGASSKAAGSSTNKQEYELIRDAKEALVSLGYRENDVQTLLKKVLEESQPKLQRAEDLIKHALRQLV